MPLTRPQPPDLALCRRTISPELVAPLVELRARLSLSGGRPGHRRVNWVDHVLPFYTGLILFSIWLSYTTRTHTNCLGRINRSVPAQPEKVDRAKAALSTKAGPMES